MARQNLENGRTFGEQRQKINDNFIELYADKADLTAVLTKTNTTIYSPSLDYHPATKAYADAREAAIIALYDPTGVSADAFDRANHTGTQPPSSIAETVNDRFVSDTQIADWDSKEPGFSKNTGFNLDLGTTVGTVAEGNHTHSAYEPANANIQTHISDTANPHATTAAQVGAEPADSAIQSHINDVFNNPHNVTALQVGLGNVDDTSDADKPVSTAQQAALDLKVDIANGYFGDTTNGHVSSFSATGLLQMQGDATVWEDITFPLAAYRLEAVTGTLQYNYSNLSITMSPSGTLGTDADTLIFTVQLPHKAKIDSLLRVHIHWEQAANSAYEFDVRYRVQNNGEAKASSWSATTTVEMANNVFSYTAGTIIQITRLIDIDLDAEGANMSSLIQFQLTRSDSVVGDIEAIAVDAHYEIDQLGSDQEYVK